MPGVTSEMKIDISGLSKLQRELGKGWYAKVGIFGTNVSRDDDSGIDNATLALIQEFGSVSRNIPPRSLIRMPIEANARGLAQYMTSGEIRKDFEAGRIEEVFTKLGIQAENYIQMAFESSGFGQWPANKPATVRRKGSSMPLIDKAELRKSISSEARNGNAA